MPTQLNKMIQQLEIKILKWLRNVFPCAMQECLSSLNFACDVTQQGENINKDCGQHAVFH